MPSFRWIHFLDQALNVVTTFDAVTLNVLAKACAQDMVMFYRFLLCFFKMIRTYGHGDFFLQFCVFFFELIASSCSITIS